ncbi:TPA: AtpZ/AtpI family protein [Burkholderia aenigmatica]|uniref:ATP synthase gene 1 n=1 Tax=Burkholderia aenigmatica TaxID=2015348 RepID=A0A6J5ISA1_9BURK|nr:MULTISPECIES: AtpZ/AtpI family protein [Burkholderia]HEM7881024.1 AtpZ/AtpI family protein [Burkholderia contaminans]MDN7515926.1 AtpZ/AtpI family protein [Burkholderia sp. AU45251]CAB3962565.1 ATP synthase gene 1 [Burkholderia aenigmatica]HDR9483063.1 AtpZ/AtpI family protein [Burkholderia aenigmatica]HDR9514011.1 AtpZ/AtpI family protein [Burkholderia aenigmatica]
MSGEPRKDAPARSGPEAKTREPGAPVLEQTAQRAVQRDRQARDVPEPTLGSRLGQIGMLGWMIVIPALLALWLGHWLDRHFHTGVFFSAPLLMLGAAFGLWSAWRWMHRQGPGS